MIEHAWSLVEASANKVGLQAGGAGQGDPQDAEIVTIGDLVAQRVIGALEVLDPRGLLAVPDVAPDPFGDRLGTVARDVVHVSHDDIGDLAQRSITRAAHRQSLGDFHPLDGAHALEVDVLLSHV